MSWLLPKYFWYEISNYISFHLGYVARWRIVYSWGIGLILFLSLLWGESLEGMLGLKNGDVSSILFLKDSGIYSALFLNVPSLWIQGEKVQIGSRFQMMVNIFRAIFKSQGRYWNFYDLVGQERDCFLVTPPLCSRSLFSLPCTNWNLRCYFQRSQGAGWGLPQNNRRSIMQAAPDWRVWSQGLITSCLSPSLLPTQFVFAVVMGQDSLEFHFFIVKWMLALPVFLCFKNLLIYVEGWEDKWRDYGGLRFYAWVNVLQVFCQTVGIFFFWRKSAWRRKHLCAFCVKHLQMFAATCLVKCTVADLSVIYGEDKFGQQVLWTLLPMWSGNQQHLDFPVWSFIWI